MKKVLLRIVLTSALTSTYVYAEESYKPVASHHVAPHHHVHHPIHHRWNNWHHHHWHCRQFSGWC
jgi:hypothetical protein